MRTTYYQGDIINNSAYLLSILLKCVLCKATPIVTEFYKNGNTNYFIQLKL